MKRDRLLVVAVASLVLLAGSTRAQQLAADLSVTRDLEPPIQGYGRTDATCVAWTDDCRTCARTGSDVICSNIGIACQPNKISCTKRQDSKAR